MKFIDHEGNALHIDPKSGVVLTSWNRGEKVEPGTTITAFGVAHRVAHPIAEVAKAFGLEDVPDK